MRFSEFNLFGVYLAPVVWIMSLAWLAFMPLRRAADRLGLMSRVWHPALFEFAVYLIVLSGIVLLIAR